MAIDCSKHEKIRGNTPYMATKNIWHFVHQKVTNEEGRSDLNSVR